MADWVHCNRCAKRYNAQTTYYLVECGHIFCQRCSEKIKASKKCLLCGKSTNVLALNKDLDKNVLDYFLPPETLLKRGIEVYKFQLQHRTDLVQNLISKFDHAKKEWMSINNYNKELIKQNKHFQDMLRSTGKNVHSFTTSTPVSRTTGPNMSFQNTSIVSSIPPHMGSARRDTPMMKTYPGYPRRSQFSSSVTSSHGPSPAQRVPLGHSNSKACQPVMIHRGPLDHHMQSLEQLRRSGGSGKSR